MDAAEVVGELAVDLSYAALVVLALASWIFLLPVSMLVVTLHSEWRKRAFVVRRDWVLGAFMLGCWLVSAQFAVRTAMLLWF